MRIETARKISLFTLSFTWGVTVSVDVEQFVFKITVPFPVIVLLFSAILFYVFMWILYIYLKWAEPGTIAIDRMSVGETQVSGKGLGHKTAITKLSEDEFEMSHYHRNKVMWTKRVKAVDDELVMYDVQEVKKE